MSQRIDPILNDSAGSPRSPQAAGRPTSGATQQRAGVSINVMSALESKQRETAFLQTFNGRLLGFQSYQLLINVVLLVVAIASVSLLLTRPVKNQYFVVDEQGRLVTQIMPLQDPLVASQKVRTFADECVKSVLNIDFIHYKRQLTSAERCFTRNGFVQIVNLMKDRGLLAELSSGSNVGSVVPRQANFLSNSGVHRGTQKWRVKGTYVWSLQQGKTTVQYPLTIEVTIVEVPMSQSVHGIAIDAMTIRRA